MQDNEVVFALDIGTRTVVGLVMENKPPGALVKAARVAEHETRAMYDGQIHDVEAVAAVITRIKLEIEEELGVPLKRAAVAAAGRALRTATARIEKQRPSYQELTREEVHALEVEAVQQAQLEVAQAEEAGANTGEYFCVGYSVINYFLEGQEIGSLVGQSGNQVAVEVIATFLPRVVVDSLFSALRRAGLEIRSLTLEPIAAVAVAIPPRMRLLNLALVDIGAGTSDIAVVRKGSIFAYAMVPVGGDEITERIAEQYLLDFNTAEAVKCRLNTCESLRFEDVLGNPLEVPAGEVVTVIREVVRELVVGITREILRLNQKPPDAVICVGGGSLTPQLLSELADALELPRNRVGMRTREAIAEIAGDFKELLGPQGVTPLGIGFTALQDKPLPFIKVVVNGREIPLWNLDETTVATALLSAGVAFSSLRGKPGMGLTVEVNGQLKVIKGGLGKPPVIKVNGATASLDTPVREGDNIEYTPGEDGEPAICTVGELISGVTGEVWVNGEKLVMVPRVYLNGQPVGLDEPVPDRARIEYSRQDSLANLLLMAGVSEECMRETVFRYRLNGQPMVYRWIPVEAEIGGKPVSLDDPVAPGSSVEYRVKAGVRLREVLPLREEYRNLQVKVNGENIVLRDRRVSIQMNHSRVTADDFLVNGAEITMAELEQGAILSDVLSYVDISPRTSGKLVMKVDGADAGFTTPIREGSEIELYWQDEKIS
ncbi:MAG: hypothetical protein GXX09_05920 [Syntrophomonadaceae bacterium]|nr:hypothetical protein [Syntrophomonadaceae bacterium]